MSKKTKKWTSSVQNFRSDIRQYKAIKRETIINPETGEYTEKQKYIDNLYSKKGYVMKYNNDYIKLFLDNGLPEECSLLDCGKFYRLIKYIIGKNQLLGYRSGTIRPFTYIKLFLDNGLPEECSLLDCGKFYRLIKYIIGKNQLLGYRSGTIRPFTVEKMSEIFKCSDRQTRRFLKQMKDLRVIKEVCINDIKWYAVNPLYALKSKYLSLTTFIIFQEELMPVLPNWVVNNFMAESKETVDKVEIKK